MTASSSTQGTPAPAPHFQLPNMAARACCSSTNASRLGPVATASSPQAQCRTVHMGLADLLPLVESRASRRRSHSASMSSRTLRSSFTGQHGPHAVHRSALAQVSRCGSMRPHRSLSAKIEMGPSRASWQRVMKRVCAYRPRLSCWLLWVMSRVQHHESCNSEKAGITPRKHGELTKPDKAREEEA